MSRSSQFRTVVRTIEERRGCDDSADADPSMARLHCAILQDHSSINEVRLYRKSYFSLSYTLAYCQSAQVILLLAIVTGIMQAR